MKGDCQLASLCGLVGFLLIRPVVTVKTIEGQKEFSELLASAKGKPIVLEYIDPGTGGLPVFQKLAKDKEFLGRVYFRKVDVKANPKMAADHGVVVAPAYQFWLNGASRKHLADADAAEGPLWYWTRKMLDDGFTTTPNPANALVPLVLSSAELAEQLQKAGDLPVVVEFVSPTCMTCITLAPVLQRLAAEYTGRALFRKIDSKQTPDTASERGVQEMPTFQFYVSGKKLHQLNGLAATEKSLLEWTHRGMADAEKGAAGRPRPTPKVDVYARPCFPKPRLRGTRPCKPKEVVAAPTESQALSKASVPVSNPCAKFRRSNPGVTEKVIIIGGGPAGMTAAIYAARGNLCPLVLAPSVGGQLMSKGVDVENYPGMPRQNGGKIISEMKQQALSFFTEARDDWVIRLNTTARPMEVHTKRNGRLQAHTIILAMGADSRWLHAKGEEDFKGHGVSACAACDGFLYRGKRCAVIGGGDTAMEEALMLSRICSSVTVVHRRDKFRASGMLQQQVLKNPKVSIRWNSEVLRFVGKVERKNDEELRALTHLELKSTLRPEEAPVNLDVDAAFVAIGHEPNTALVKGQVEMDTEGYVNTLERSTRTSAHGVFAAGDVADHIYRQAVTSAGSGAMAALDAGRWLGEHVSGDDPWAQMEDGADEADHPDHIEI